MALTTRRQVALLYAGAAWALLSLGALPCGALHYEYKGVDMEVRVAELMFELQDGAESCFYMKGLKDDPMEIEFEVVEGGQMDIDYHIKDPEGTVLDSLTKEIFGYFKTEKLPLLGDYELCFSNEMSRFTHKKIFFRWTMGSNLDGFLTDPDHNIDDINALSETPEYNNLEYDILQIREGLVEIEENLDHARNREHRHRSTVESISTRVWLWSITVTATIVGVSAVQVKMIKGLFNTR